MVHFNKTALAAILTIVASTSTVMATPPPELVDALSAYAAAGVTPTIPAGIKDVHRMAKRAEQTLAARAAAAAQEEIVILPSGHRPFKQLPDSFKRGTRMMKEARAIVERGDDHDDEEKSSSSASSSSASSSSSSSSSKAASKTSSSAAASRSIDSHHYWWVEDSPDQEHWRQRSAAVESKRASEKKQESKRGFGHFFDNLKSDFDRTASKETPTGAAPTGFKKVSLHARAESVVSSIDSSSVTTTPAPAPAPATTAAAASSIAASISAAAASASISQAAQNLTWYNPTTWPSGISAEITQEKNSIRDTINKMNMLSKIGLATLVLVSTICLGFLTYCLCKLNIRRRRRNAAERVAAKLEANPPTRAYGGSATVPMPSTGFSPRPAGAVPSNDKKGKRRNSWSRG
ncbi:hypothetical protein JCM10908_003544 [Rhodotorula pacifica]|uniref:uncharacterized protein n=1 Tax=Rhodotorula pacifica TaxID=1495444 RepID=UPI00316D6B88